MKKDKLVRFDDRDFNCVDVGFAKNEAVDIVIRPEDIKICKKDKGMLNGQVLSVLFKGVHYEVIVETKRGASKKVKLHVLSDVDVENKNNNENMHATNFTMDIEDVANIEDAELIRRSNAQAWVPETEEDISITEVIQSIQPEAGKYPITFKTNKGTEITTYVNVVNPKVIEDKKENIGIQAFDIYKSVEEIKESMAISVDLKTWADAYAWNLDDDSEVDVDDVRFDFDPMEITEGDYEVEFVTEGRQYKIHTTEFQEEGKEVSLKIEPDAIHVMSKMVN